MIKLFTWVDHHVDGDSLGLRHETQGWEDGEAGDEAGPTVECTQPQAIPAHTHTHTACSSQLHVTHMNTFLLMDKTTQTKVEENN